MSVSLDTHHQIPSPPQSATTSPRLLSSHPTTSRTSSNNDVIENNRVLISSFMYKRSTHRKHWKKKWLVLRKCQLSYYKDSREHKPLKVYNASKLLSFNVIPDNHRNHLAVYTTNKVLHFRTDDDALFTKWIDAWLEFFNLKNHSNDADEEEYEDFEDTEELYKDTSTEQQQRQQQHHHQQQGECYDGDAGSVSSSILQPPPTLPIHSIQNRQSQAKRTGSYTSDSINTETSDDMYSSDGFTSDSPLTPNAPPSSLTSPFFNTLDVPREEDERDKSPMKPKPRGEEKESALREVAEYTIEEGSLEVLRRKYNQQWKKYHVTLTSRSLKLDIPHGNILNIPVYDIEDVIELDPISSKRQWCLMIITPLKRLRFSCGDEAEMTKWFSAFKAASQTNKRK
ncbi:Pleckstrin y domain-containing family A member 7 [Candida viswanathii]|uniref:Pleckstrin y domain-containing family A member 7 n=1 Tax=Candida viswanathii TaxID=5486 RepID=A0A367YHE1_9ASCO|nr:Pleckstrin y domain-containing family A member 7 [Candida viswanathii]